MNRKDISCIIMKDDDYESQIILTMNKIIEDESSIIILYIPYDTL